MIKSFEEFKNTNAIDEEGDEHYNHDDPELDMEE